MKIATTTLFAAVTATALAASAAPAQTRQAQVTVTSPRGTSTLDRTVARQPGAATVNSVATGPAGRSATRSAERSYSREEGFAHSSTLTGPQGGVRTTEGSASCANGDCSRSLSSTGPKGRTRTVSGSSVRVEPGVREGQRTVVTPRGETRTGKRWVRVRRP